MNFTKTVQGDTESISIINSENSRKLRRVKDDKNQSQNNDSNFHSPIIKKRKKTVITRFIKQLVLQYKPVKKSFLQIFSIQTR